MRRDRLEHAHPCAAREPERLPAAPGDGERALGIRALGADLVARARLHHHGRAAERHPQATEPPSAAAGGVEHAHVQPRGRLDADRRHPLPTAARTCRRTSSIASCSRGPAVLSTGTWRRSSSARTSAAGSRRAREAMIDASSTA